MNKQQIEKAKEDFDFFYEGDYITREMEQSKDIILEYIRQLESKLKQLGKGQQTLLQSRRKWKNKYYKQRRKSKDLKKSVEQIYDDYQDIGKMYFDLDENVQAVKVLCRQKYTDPVVEELTNIFFDMLSKGEENK